MRDVSGHIQSILISHRDQSSIGFSHLSIDCIGLDRFHFSLHMCLSLCVSSFCLASLFIPPLPFSLNPSRQCVCVWAILYLSLPCAMLLWNMRDMGNSVFQRLLGILALGVLLVISPVNAAKKQPKCKSSLDFILTSPQSSSVVYPGEEFAVQLELPRKSICRKKGILCRFEVTVPDGAILMSQDLEDIQITVDAKFSSLVSWTPTMVKQTITFSADACAPVHKLPFSFRLIGTTSRFQKKIGEECLKSKKVRT